MAYLCSFKWRQQLFSKGFFFLRKIKSFRIYSWVKDLSRACCCVESFTQKKWHIVHIRKYEHTDCCTQLHEGIPPQKLWIQAKIEQLQRTHLMGRMEVPVPAGEGTDTEDGISKVQGLWCFCTQTWDENWTRKRTQHEAAHTSQRQGD